MAVDIPEGVEAVYGLFIQIRPDPSLRVKKIMFGSFYVSPNSLYKAATIEHIIDTTHVFRSRYDNEVNFILGGDFNRLNISDIFYSYGELNQLISVPT